MLAHIRKLGNVHVVAFFHSLWGHAWLDSTAIAISNYGLLISLAAFAFGLWRGKTRELLPWFALGAVMCIGMDLLAGHLFFDRRPFVALNVVPLFPHSADNGFPSDHSTVAAFIAAILWFVDVPSAAVATIAAAAIGAARIYALVHWPIDVLGGWVIGVLPAVVTMGFWKRRSGLRS